MESESIQAEMAQEWLVASSLGSGMIRLGGMCTFGALLLWIYGAVWANQWITHRIVMQKLNMLTSASMSNGSPNDESATTEADAVDPPAASVDPPAGAASGRRSEAMRPPTPKWEQFSHDFTRTTWIQGLIQILWLVVLILTGAFMLCAAVAGLSGSARSRRWHRQVVYWSVLSAACTVGGLLALARWGGFPPIEDAWILGKIAAVELFYAFAIILALLIFRRPALKERARARNLLSQVDG